MKWETFVGFLSIFIAAGMSNASGLGGGLLFIPVLLLIMNFYPHEAIPISKIVIFAGALTSFIQNTKVKRPGRNAKALNYNLVIVNAPNLLLGTVLGVTLNKILPNAIILFLLCLLLFYYSYKTFKTFLKLYREESSGELHSMSSQFNTISHVNNDINNQEERPIEAELFKDQFLLRWDKLKYILIPFLIMAGLSLLRESEIISKCSSLYWFLMFSFLIIGLAYDYFIINHIETEYSYRKIINFPYDEKDINWTKSTIIKLCCIGFIAGFVAGVIGIGGGVVLGPILLDLGIHPVVGTVTTNMLVLITSSSTTFQFILFKMLNIQYGIICIIFSALGSYCGTYLVNTYVKKTGKQSFIVLVLFCVVIISAAVLPLSSLLNIIDDYRKGYNIFEFESLCL
jgi:uncharacterized membrane protein YfcA